MYKHMMFTKFFMNTDDAIIELDRLINMEIWIQMDNDCEPIYSKCHICNKSTLLHGYYKYNDGKSGIDLIEKYDCHIFCKKSKKLRVLLAISQMKESCITYRRVI